MRLLAILFFAFILCTLACGKENLTGRAVVECPVIAEAKILDKDDLPCNYNAVYSFKGEIYTHCVCCACFKWDPPVNCEGQTLCESQGDCWTEFLEEAQYLFAVEEL